MSQVKSNVQRFCWQQLSGRGRENHKSYYTTLAYPLGRREGAAADSTVRPCDDASQLTLQQQAPVRLHPPRRYVAWKSEPNCLCPSF